MHYTQVTLQRIHPEGGFARYVVWIPSMFAKLFSTINVECKAWKIVNIWGTKEDKWIEPKARDFLKQREASDI